LFLLPPRTTHKITTNHDARVNLQYSLANCQDGDFVADRDMERIENNIIELRSDGHVRTKSELGKATIHIEEIGRKYAR